MNLCVLSTPLHHIDLIHAPVGQASRVYFMKIEINTTIPCPTGRQRLEGQRATIKRTLLEMNPGDSFTYNENKPVYDAAKQAGVAITTRKIDGGYRVWKR